MTSSATAIRLSVAIILVTYLSVGKAEPYGSGWYGELQASVGYEDNISRSFYSGDEESDEIISVSLGGGHSQKVRNNGQIVFYGYLAFNKHNNFSDLDNLAATLGASFTHQFNPGYNSTWYVTDFSATVLRYDDSEAREGVMFNGDLSVNRRLGSRATWRLGYRYNDLVFLGKTSTEETRDAAFDTATHELYLGLDHQVRRNVFVYGEVAFRRGGAWSNVSFNAPLAQYDQETIDRVFDRCSVDDLRCQPRYAGRVESDIYRLNVGVAFPFKAVNMDISAVYYDAKGDNGRSYKDAFISAGLIWNF